ncbi:ADP-ribosylglycohydrolase family protein [Paenibacillus ginsengarvi]|uniref:ADP-ribosylglycohydrolase family protein n=1 Tax=Paenibacillus ginsengarvi TaxID=400777 RepID=A0A3B0C7Z2_9BACL|nr:ADP-ribosylglycohydrolase family protein [Paenibacillus ginsengarvi]RKN80479.1 ADP-ribosylglycohydrolase family protein [Paenibacillus ginsengarvi]
MAGWTSLDELVQKEVVQRLEEGCKVDGYAEKVQAAGTDEAKLMDIYNELMALPVQEDFPFSEPSELNEIRAERPEGPRQLAESMNEAQWRDKFYGAWLGRSAGCALGKPLEAWAYMGGTADAPGWLNVKRWFEGADAWPIQGYTPEHSRAEQEYGLALATASMRSTREQIRFMETDDDIRYTVLGLIMLEEKGLNFDSFDIGKLWHRRLAYRQVCTAETQAYLNFTQATSHQKGKRPEDWEARQEWVRTYLNPYREWIGAQIRADGFAYGAAGNPELAAELAWRDASFSHVKNGIYGEMFCAAMIAAAFVESDPERIVRIGLSEIPRNSRLYHDIEQAIAIAKEATDQVQLVDKLWETFKHYHPVHTNNNAALVAASIIFAKGDFETAIATSVLGGWDTDCNGATVGSIMGAALGANQLPAKWTEPLNDTLFAELIGFHPITISECANRTYEVFNNIRATAATQAQSV